MCQAISLTTPHTDPALPTHRTTFLCVGNTTTCDCCVPNETGTIFLTDSSWKHPRAHNRRDVSQCVQIQRCCSDTAVMKAESPFVSGFCMLCLMFGMLRMRYQRVTFTDTLLSLVDGGVVISMPDSYFAGLCHGSAAHCCALLRSDTDTVALCVCATVDYSTNDSNDRGFFYFLFFNVCRPVPPVDRRKGLHKSCFIHESVD